MDRLPTADMVAAGYVAACRETGENPRDYGKPTQRGVPGSGRARHYLFQALRKAHAAPPKGDHATVLARLAGARQNPTTFAVNSQSLFRPYISQHAPSYSRPRWYKDDAFDRVVAAIEAAKGVDPLLKPTPTDAPSSEPVKPDRSASHQIAPKPASGGARCGRCGRAVSSLAQLCRQCYTRQPVRAAAAARYDEAAVVPADRFSGFSSAQPPAPAPGKRQLEEMLAEAVRNTAKMQPQGD